jgi:Lamin Tail Domain
MIFINEWFPNPAGDDAKGEFIELFNKSSAPANLNGWILKTTGKKIFSLDGYTIAANGYLVLDRTETKLSLKNTAESLFLYDAAGKLADQSSFLGAAPEGKSFSRINYMADPSEHFTWSAPTPGIANDITINTSISDAVYPLNAPLNDPSLGAGGFFGLMFAAGVILAALVVYCLKSDENLSKLFFD